MAPAGEEPPPRQQEDASDPVVSQDRPLAPTGEEPPPRQHEEWVLAFVGEGGRSDRPPIEGADPHTVSLETETALGGKYDGLWRRAAIDWIVSVCEGAQDDQKPAPIFSLGPQAGLSGDSVFHSLLDVTGAQPSGEVARASPALSAGVPRPEPDPWHGTCGGSLFVVVSTTGSRFVLPHGARKLASDEFCVRRLDVESVTPAKHEARVYSETGEGHAGTDLGAFAPNSLSTPELLTWRTWERSHTLSYSLGLPVSDAVAPGLAMVLPRLCSRVSRDEGAEMVTAMFLDSEDRTFSQKPGSHVDAEP